MPFSPPYFITFAEAYFAAAAEEFSPAFQHAASRDFQLYADFLSAFTAASRITALSMADAAISATHFAAAAVRYAFIVSAIAFRFC